MEDIKQILAENIIDLRRKQGLTQAELAEKLNYSDKAVSKWERAESVPDITVIKQIAENFGVTVDYLMSASHEVEEENKASISRRKMRNRTMITCISVFFVLLIATGVYVNVDIISALNGQWMTFVYAVPICLIVWLVFNSIWFNRRRNFFIISLLMWSVLIDIFLTGLVFFQMNYWLLFLIGIPSQIIIVLWSGIRIREGKKVKK